MSRKRTSAGGGGVSATCGGASTRRTEAGRGGGFGLVIMRDPSAWRATWGKVPCTTLVTRHRVNRRGRAEALPERPLPGRLLAFADSVLPARRVAPPGLAGLHIVFPLAQFLLLAASLEQLLEPAQGHADGLPLVDAHPQRHALSSEKPSRQTRRHPADPRRSPGSEGRTSSLVRLAPTGQGVDVGRSEGDGRPGPQS